MISCAEADPYSFLSAYSPNNDVSTMDVWEIVNHLLGSYHQVLSLSSRLV
jgi:hypothetical protein